MIEREEEERVRKPFRKANLLSDDLLSANTLTSSPRIYHMNGISILVR